MRTCNAASVCKCKCNAKCCCCCFLVPPRCVCKARGGGRGEIMVSVDDDGLKKGLHGCMVLCVCVCVVLCCVWRACTLLSKSPLASTFTILREMCYTSTR